MRYRICALVLVAILMSPTRANAIFGFGETALLAKILANAVSQLTRLGAILDQERSTLDFLREINRGINDSLQLATTIRAGIQPGLYGGYSSTEQAIRDIEALYGSAPASKNEKLQRDADQSVAETLAMHQAVHAYTQQVDAIGEQIKTYSHAVSPGGAQKLTAQSLGVVLHVLNESLRMQSSGIKLQAQMMAIENKQEKDWARHMGESSQEISQGMKNSKLEFGVPRFTR